MDDLDFRKAICHIGIHVGSFSRLNNSDQIRDLKKGDETESLSAFLAYNKSKSQYYVYHKIHQSISSVDYSMLTAPYPTLFLFLTHDDEVVAYHSLNGLMPNVDVFACGDFKLHFRHFGFFYATIKCVNSHGSSFDIYKEECELVSTYHYLHSLLDFKNKLKSFNLTEVYQSIRNTVCSYNLREILKDMDIVVEFDTSPRPRDAEWSFDYTQIITTSYPKDKLDKYLINYLQIGNFRFSEDCTYVDTFWRRLSNESKLITVLYHNKVSVNKDDTPLIGKYPKVLVEEIKEYLIDNYSIDAHIDSLFNYNYKNPFSDCLCLVDKHFIEPNFYFLVGLGKIYLLYHKFSSYPEYIANVNKNLLVFTRNPISY